MSIPPRGTRLGTFTYLIQIGPLDGSRFESVEALVDTGATYTWVPAPLLEQLGVNPSDRRQFTLANGQVIEREVGLVLVRLDSRMVATLCVFGDADSMALLGAVTLEEASLAPDPVRRRLVPVTALMMPVVAGVSSHRVAS